MRGAGQPRQRSNDERRPPEPNEEFIADLEEAMRDVVDPELGINVVDLGLVYGTDRRRGGHGTVALIDMTLTSAACPLTDVIEDQSRTAWSAQAWCGKSRSTGCGTRRGGRTRSPRTAASSCGRSASPSENQPAPGRAQDQAPSPDRGRGLCICRCRPWRRLIVVACSAPLPSLVPFRRHALALGDRLGVGRGLLGVFRLVINVTAVSEALPLASVLVTLMVLPATEATVPHDS